MTKLEIFDDIVDIMKKDSSSCKDRQGGDAFVKTMGMSSQVTVVGRPTMGIRDYSDCNFVDYGAYKLVYPTSLDKGKFIARNGVPVDVYIPWTPEHLKRDVDLVKVMELIELDLGK